MPSSISSSRARAAIAMLFAGILLLGALAEASATVGLSRISKIQRRIDVEAASALHLQRLGAGEKPTLLLVGNSLLLEGIDFPEFKRLIAGRYDAHRFVIEQTAYTDWYFGLKRLFRHGSQPSELVLALSVGQMLGDVTRGEFSARYMLDIRDFPEAARREHLDATTASNFLFAHYSGWLASRSDIRKWVLNRLLPDAAELATVLGFRPAPPFSPRMVQSEIPFRLAELRALCQEYGVKVTLLVPPAADSEDGSALVSRIGAQTGVSVLVPAKPAEFPKDLFRDGFHLNPKGADRLTSMVATVLLDRSE
jgi:hypothetical protein